MLRSRGLGRLMNPRRIPLTLGAAAGGLLAAAFLPVAVASADDDVGMEPEDYTLAPTEVTGTLPGTEVITGQESWIPFDFTTGQPAFSSIPPTNGVDTETIIGSMTNNLFTSGDFSGEFYGGFLPAIDLGTLSVDLANYGGGWENEFIYLTAAQGGGIDRMGDLIITPLGDIEFGNFFSEFIGPFP